MSILIQEGDFNAGNRTYVCESLEDVEAIPADTPVGSFAFIPAGKTSDNIAKFYVKMNDGWTRV